MNKGGKANRAWLLLAEPASRGARIRRLRILANMTQTRLAEAAARAAGMRDGLTKSFVSLLEADRTEPSVRTLLGLARALGCSMDYLETGEAFGERQRAPLVRAELVVDRRPAPEPEPPAPRVAVRVRRKLPGGKWEEQTREVSQEAAARLLRAQESAGAPPKARRRTSTPNQERAGPPHGGTSPAPGGDHLERG